MSSQSTFGSNMLFQSINDDLNASLSVADELSKEFNSLMKETSTSNKNTTSGSQSPQTSSRNQSLSSGPSSLSSSTQSSGNHTNGSSKAISSVSTNFYPIDSGMSSSRNAPSPPVISSSPHSSPNSHRVVRPSHQRSGSDSFTFKPQSPKQSLYSKQPTSPSYYERSPQGSIAYKERTSSPSRTPGAFDQSPRSVSHQTAFNLLTPNDNSQMGLRSPRHDKGPSPLSFRSPSPLPYNQPASSTLPRNFHSSAQTDESVKRQKSPSKWSETDLDMSYERKPHHSYDKTEWLRTSVPNSSWRESNLDGPPPLSSPKKDQRLISSQGSYSSLPRNVCVSVPPEDSSQGHFRRDKTNAPYYSPPISRIAIPPTSSQTRQSKPMPLSVILRLQNPYFGAMRHPQALEGERNIAFSYPPAPVPREFFTQQAFQPQQQPSELRQPAVYSDALHSGDVDAEVERLDIAHHGPVISENPAIPAGGGEVERAVAPAPRPLSPTRLQPVVAPEAQSHAIPDLEELLRIRAEIPRPLKRRGSVDVSQPLKKALDPQPNQYKNLINKLFHRKAHSHRGEQSSDGSSSSDEDSDLPPVPKPAPQTSTEIPPDVKTYNSILRQPKRDRKNFGKRARLSPLVLMLDGALMGELDTVKRAAQEMTDPSQPNDEGITGLHNAICGGHYDVVDFLVRTGVNVSASDSHGWTPLHCAASCNDRILCEFLVRNGAAVMAMTHSDSATASQKCDPYLAGFEECENYLRGMEEAMGVENSGVLYALWSYLAQAADELSFKDGDMITILQKPEASDWWWASLCGKEGLVPKNYFGLFPKVRPKSQC